MITFKALNSTSHALRKNLLNWWNSFFDGFSLDKTSLSDLSAGLDPAKVTCDIVSRAANGHSNDHLATGHNSTALGHVGSAGQIGSAAAGHQNGGDYRGGGEPPTVEYEGRRFYAFFVY